MIMQRKKTESVKIDAYKVGKNIDYNTFSIFFLFANSYFCDEQKHNGTLNCTIQRNSESIISLFRLGLLSFISLTKE